MHTQPKIKTHTYMNEYTQNTYTLYKHSILKYKYTHIHLHTQKNPYEPYADRYIHAQVHINSTVTNITHLYYIYII